MKRGSKIYLILAGLILSLGLFVYIYQQKGASTNLSFFKFKDIAKCTRFELGARGEKLVFIQKGRDWFVGNQKIDKEKIGAFKSLLASLQINASEDSMPEIQDSMMINHQDLVLYIRNRFLWGSVKKIYHYYCTSSKIYLQDSKKNQVYTLGLDLQNIDFTSYFSPHLEDWTDKSLLNLYASQIDSLAIAFPDSSKDISIKNLGEGAYIFHGRHREGMDSTAINNVLMSFSYIYYDKKFSLRGNDTLRTYLSKSKPIFCLYVKNTLAKEFYLKAYAFEDKNAYQFYAIRDQDSLIMSYCVLDKIITPFK